MMTPGTSSMLRARRRDVNVKPNRRLDRKSSRGMLYENEELRLRTININAEVERGQNDIKKLRRENEQLRREIWGLREEYDRLEGLLGKAKRRGQLGHTSQDSDSENEEMCEDEDEEYDEQEEDDDECSSQCEHSADLDNAENQQKASSSSIRTPGHSRRNSLRVEFDGLSIVDEETETVSNDVTPVETCAENGASVVPSASRQADVSFGGVKQESDICPEILNLNQVDGARFNTPNGRHRNDQQFFGKIKLPNGKEGVFMSDAMLPDSDNISSGLPVYGCNNFKGNSYELGPITGFNPNDYHILNENVWSKTPETLLGASQNEPQPQSHYNYTFTPVDSTMLSNGASARDNNAFETTNEFPDANSLSNVETYRDARTEHGYLERGGNSVLHGFGVNDDTYFGMGENIEETRTINTGDEIIPDYYHKRGGPDLFISGAYPVTRSPGSFPVGVNLDQLLKQMNNRESENVSTVAVTEATGSGTSVAKPESDDKEIPQEDGTEKAQEVIDALETQIDSKLDDAVCGVRVANGNCYVCLAKEDNVGALLQTGLTIRGAKINLEDVSRDSLIIALSGVSHDVPDITVARAISNYGTVIGDVERRFYKGVDTGERFIRMKPADADIKDVPSVLNLAGSKATLRIMKPDEIKELASACVPESAGVSAGTDNDKTSNAPKTRAQNGENTTKLLDSFTTDRYRSQLNVRLRQPNMKTNRSLENIFDSVSDRAQHNTSLPIIGTCDSTSTKLSSLKMSSENTLSETQFKKTSSERLFDFGRQKTALSPKFPHPQQLDALHALSAPQLEAIPKRIITENSKEPQLTSSVQENKITKPHSPKETQSSPEISNHTPNIFSKLPNRKSKCHNAPFLSTTDESTDSADFHSKSSPSSQLQSNPFVGNFRTSSPNNTSPYGYPRTPFTPVHANPFISNIPNANHTLIYQDFIPHNEQSVHCYNTPNLPQYQGIKILEPDFTILPSPDNQQFFLQQGTRNSRACSPYSHTNASYTQSSQPTNITFNELTYVPNSSSAPFPGTSNSLPTTIAPFSTNQSATSSGANNASSLPQNNNTHSHPSYSPNNPLSINESHVPTPKTSVPSNAPFMTYVPGNTSVVLPSGRPTSGSVEYFPISSDIPGNTLLVNVSSAQSANLSVPNTSSSNTTNIPTSQDNLNPSQILQYSVNEGNNPIQGQSDVTENTLEVPRTQTTSAPPSPVMTQKETSQPKISRKSSILPRQQSKSSGDEGPNLSPPTAHVGAAAPTASPGTARRKASRKMSCTNSTGSHHNVENTINESSVGPSGPNATSSPNTKHRGSVMHHRKTSSAVSGGADVQGGGHANVIDVSRSSSSGAGKRRDSSFVPNGSNVPGGGILSRSLSLQQTNHYTGGSTSDIAAGHCVGAEAATNSERERTNSISSRTSSATGVTGSNRMRKHSVCSTRGVVTSESGKVPWCGCWGNGCI
ncbi:uncharacterized protein LOC110833001 isoform X2 [Zootermopsis nevadensis]|uniref:uncharacterized protein LOC110833001 isoform X2 n=1 Tax=Zootermopsis nevadensis TaxID=136037 RepID=UPI000B8E93C4|nr:uncharacterized protein LOC110833001 isoform X2 [Zootermopsis nevadensis]